MRYNHIIYLAKISYNVLRYHNIWYNILYDIFDIRYLVKISFIIIHDPSQGSMKSSINTGWRLCCKSCWQTNGSRTASSTRSESTRTPQDCILGGHAEQLYFFSNCPDNSGSWHGADLRSAVHRRHLHQARDSNPTDIL